MSGLGDLGLGNLENIDIFSDPGKKNEQEGTADAVQKNVVQEKDMIYDKSFVCPVCENKFTNKIVKTGKVRLLGMDRDLRPRHEGIDTQKYDVVLCPKCGYAAVSRFFPQITSGQQKQIKEQISTKVHLHEYNGETYSFEEAVERYKLALVCAVVKRSKNSEKAYICLKSAWLLRGYLEKLEEDPKATQEEKKVAEQMENSHMQNAYKGFLEAVQSESFPMCGMDEMTVNYLLAVLAFRFREFDIASKMTAKILSSPAASMRIKDKARDLKDEILQELKKISK